MRRVLLTSAMILAGQAPAATVRNPGPPQGGNSTCAAWDAKIMVGPKDSLVTTAVMTVTSGGKHWIKFPGRDSIPARVLASGGDSVVMVLGPYRSIVRPGQMVTTRTTSHYKGRTMVGTLEAHYASGEVLRGKVVATCTK
jgi:hypothetical protein